MRSNQIAEREFRMTKANFDTIAAMIRDNTGIQLSERKQDMVYARLSRRLRSLGLREFDQYLALVNTPDGKQELVQLVNALTTNLTKFFRETHHLDHLRDVVLPEVQATLVPGSRGRFRIWSAGCSTGQEPYSIAIAMQESAANISHWDSRILATDLDTHVLETGAKGEYSSRDIEQLDNNRQKWFKVKDTGPKKSYQIDPALQKMIAFKKLNLMGSWPMKGPFDAIFCRNVMIYFDKPTQSALIDRFASLLKPGGYLYVGHSEVLLTSQTRFRALGHTIYQRID